MEKVEISIAQEYEGEPERQKKLRWSFFNQTFITSNLFFQLKSIFLWDRKFDLNEKDGRSISGVDGHVSDFAEMMEKSFTANPYVRLVNDKFSLEIIF